jgi:hypothetical protein
MSIIKKEEKIYTCELQTSRRDMKAINKGTNDERGFRNCARSMVNQYMHWYPEVFNRWSGGNWMKRKHFESNFRELYDELLDEIMGRVTWTFDTQEITQHGMLSHSAMKSAIQAVFA